MPLLYFESVKKIRPAGDSAPYESNISEQDRLKFRAKHIKGADERVEIRTGQFGSETLVIVCKNAKHHGRYFAYDDHENIRISANGKMHFTFNDFALLNQAVQEARAVLGV